jgi:hypothetical protein
MQVSQMHDYINSRRSASRIGKIIQKWCILLKYKMIQIWNAACSKLENSPHSRTLTGAMFWAIFPPAALPTVADRRLRKITPCGRLRSAHLYRHFIISPQTCGRIQTDIWRFQTDSHGIQTDNLLWTFYATRYFFYTILLFCIIYNNISIQLLLCYNQRY